MKKSILFLMAVMLNCFIGGAVAMAAGFAPIAGAITTNVVAAFAPQAEGLRAGLYTELWTGETIKAFRNSIESVGWLNRIRSYDSAVANNNTINFVDLGGDPEVLINNTTYPIEITNLTDKNIAVNLDKYQTKSIRVTDDEIRGLSYDKKSTVIERTREVVDQTKIAKALHALAPTENTDTTPIVMTSGAVDAASPAGTRKPITLADVIALKKAFDKQKVDANGRILVLSPEHVADLLLTKDQNFANQYYNYQTGKVMNLFGFEVYEYVDCPYYKADATKVAYGAIPGATDGMASVAFSVSRVMKATGETKAYVDAPDTTTQEWRYNVRHYFIALPFKQEALGAIVSSFTA